MTALAQTKNLGASLAGLTKHKDLIIAVLIVGVIAMMIVPIPAFLLDILLPLMISIALTILLVSMYIENVLYFSVYPGMLLIITLFRLGLNVATTRLVLAEGEAGAV